MLAVGSTAPISAEHELAASRKGLNEKFSRLADGIPANFQVRDTLAEVINVVHSAKNRNNPYLANSIPNPVIMNARSLLDGEILSGCIFVKMKSDLVDIDAANHQLKELDALGRIRWAWQKFGTGVVASTSFGLQSAVMIHLIREVSKEIPIVFIDTGYLFPGTYEYALKLQDKLGFKASVYSAKQSPAFQEASFGKLWEQGKEGMAKYNWINKKEPMDRALKETGAKLWLAGLRRSQASDRKNLNFLEEQNGVLKLYPILDWDDRKTYQYIPQNDLPYHPLEGMDYDSVGDWHSTRKISEVENVEDARHGGHGRECGLHIEVPEGTDFTV